MNHTLRISAAACMAIIAVSPLSVAAPPTNDPVSVRKVAVYDKGAKRFNVTGYYAVFGGQDHLSEHASDNSIGTLGQVIKDYIAENAEFKNASLKLTPTVTVSGTEVISVFYKRMIDTGGAHPASDFLAFSYGYVAGRAKALALADLFQRGEPDVAAVLKTLVVPKLRAKGVGRDRLPTTIKTWAITPKGILCLFAAGEIDTYASGEYQIVCGWRELQAATGSGLSDVVRSLAHF